MEAIIEKRDVVFGCCAGCSRDIMRSQKRKIDGEKFYHIECFNPAPQATNAAGMGVLADMLAPFIEAKIKTSSRDEIAAQIKELMPQTQTIALTRPDGKQIEIRGAHIGIPKLLNLVNRRMHVYMYGPAGSGKSTAANQVADSLGLYFGYIALNQQTPESRIIGYMDATGTYRETEFYRCYTNGGVFCIDEMDNANQGLLATLNGALENGHFAFPCGMRKRHGDFVVVATGNTAGYGASRTYSERRKFDGALLQRFISLFWDYDLTMEKALTLSINPNAVAWLGWVRDVRKYCFQNYPDMIVSPRSAFRGATLWNDPMFTTDEIADMVLFQGIKDDTREAIIRECGNIPTDGR